MSHTGLLYSRQSHTGLLDSRHVTHRPVTQPRPGPTSLQTSITKGQFNLTPTSCLCSYNPPPTPWPQPRNCMQWNSWPVEVWRHYTSGLLTCRVSLCWLVCTVTSLSAVVTVLLTFCWHLMFGPEMTADWRKLRGEALHDVYRRTNIR